MRSKVMCSSSHCDLLLAAVCAQREQHGVMWCVMWCAACGHLRAKKTSRAQGGRFEVRMSVVRPSPHHRMPNKRDGPGGGSRTQRTHARPAIESNKPIIQPADSPSIKKITPSEYRSKPIHTVNGSVAVGSFDPPCHIPHVARRDNDRRRGVGGRVGGRVGGWVAERVEGW